MMKNTAKLSIALALTLTLSVVGLTVWAAPERQGTVPVFPDMIPVTGLVPVTGGTFEVTLLGDCKAEGIVTRIELPEEEFGPAPAGWTFLSDVIKVELNGACDIQVCFAYPQEYEDKDGNIYKWDEEMEEWGELESTVSGIPTKICAIEKVSDGGVYGLIGK